MKRKMTLTVTHNTLEHIPSWLKEYMLDEMMAKIIPSWPKEHMLNEMMAGINFSSLIGLLQFEAMSSGGIMVRLGNSRSMIRVEGNIEKGKEGMEQLKIMARNFADGIRISVGEMSGDYKKLYKQVLADFDERGLIMPFVGRII